MKLCSRYGLGPIALPPRLPPKAREQFPGPSELDVWRDRLRLLDRVRHLFCHSFLDSLDPADQRNIRSLSLIHI